MAGLGDLLSIGAEAIPGAGGGLVPVSRPAYGGYQVNLPQQAPAQPAPHHGGIGNLLGIIGDALLVAHGKEPAYHNYRMQEQQTQALQGFLTDPDTAIARLMQVPGQAGTAIDLYKVAHPPSEKTMEQKVYEYEQSLPADQRPAFEKSIQLTHPGLMAPVTLGPNDSVEMPGGAAPGGPAPGMVVKGFRFKGGNPNDRNSWEPAGGQTPQASGNFSVDDVMPALIHVESRGNGMAVSPKGAKGTTQLMAPTAQEMANKLGLPFRPDMLQSNDPAALHYQHTLGRAYLQEGYRKTGNMRDALRYYNGGPNFAAKPQTNAYADAVLSRMGGQ